MYDVVFGRYHHHLILSSYKSVYTNIAAAPCKTESFFGATQKKMREPRFDKDFFSAIYIKHTYHTHTATNDRDLCNIHHTQKVLFLLQSGPDLKREERGRIGNIWK